MACPGLMFKEPRAGLVKSYNDFCTKDQSICHIGDDISNKVITRHPNMEIMDYTKGDGDWYAFLGMAWTFYV
jgi:hypothetical protein